MTKLLSIHLPSNRPVFFRRLVTNLAERAVDRTCFEVVVKVDDNDQAMQQEVAAIARDLGVTIVPIVSPPPRDYYDLSRFCNDAFVASDPDAYFCWHVNDEVLVNTDRWDEFLRGYVGLFPDNLFRLKISPGKMFRTIFDVHEVNLYADFPITTRRWLELTDGWAHGHGAEPYQEAIALELANRNIHRSVPLPKFSVGGDDPGNNIEAESAKLRNERMQYYWDQNMAPGLREQINRSAARIELCVTAGEMGLPDFTLQENPSGKYISLVTADQRVMSRVWFHVDPLWIGILNLRHIARRNTEVWPHSLWGKPLWYRALVWLWRGGESIANFLYMTIYLPIAALFGAPIRCWYARALERQVVKHWDKLVRTDAFLARRAPRLRRLAVNSIVKLRGRGWMT